MSLDAVLDSMLPPDTRKASRAAIEHATALPRQAYVSEEVWRLELQRLFARTWVSVAFEAQLPNPGDALPVWFAEWPLLLTRDLEGDLHVFHNVCPRDGCPAVLEASNLEKVVGPYHGWVWQLDGRLERATLFDGTTTDDRAAYGSSPASHDADLAPIRFATWQGVVFVNVDGEAPAFEEYIAPVAELYSDLDLSVLTAPIAPDGGPTIDPFVFDANWKTAYENFAINVNHESFVHDMYARSPEIPRVLHGHRLYDEIDDRGYQGLRFAASAVSETYPAIPELPGIHHLDGAPLEDHTIMTLFPNTNISLFPQHLCITIYNPLAPNRTGYDTTVRFHRDLAALENAADIAAAFLAAWAEARNEDAVVCAAVQRARRSPAFSQHWYAPFWDKMHHTFNQHVLDALEAN